jgi:hypothetical protein
MQHFQRMPPRRAKRKDKVVPEFAGHCSVCFSAVRTRDSVTGHAGAVHHLSCWLVRRLVSTRPAPRAA